MGLASPTVSVVMPVKNGERFLSTSIRSILDQSFDDFELIIVNDASTDRTIEVGALHNDLRIKWLDNDMPLGIVASLNRGIETARGEYIARIDCDDRAEPNRFARQVAVLAENPEIGLVGSWMRTFGERFVDARYPVSDPDIRLWMLFGTPFGHPAVMFKREWDSGAIGYYDGAYELAEDYELWTRISATWETCNIPEFLTHYRVHSKQSTNEKIGEREDCVRRIAEAHFERLGLVIYPEAPSFAQFLRWWSYLENSDYAQTLLSRADFGFILRRQLLRLLRRKLAFDVKR